MSTGHHPPAPGPDRRDRALCDRVLWRRAPGGHRLCGPVPRGGVAGRRTPCGRVPRGRARCDRGRRRDRGMASIEFLGFLPLLLAVALGAIQLGIGAYTAQQAGTAARAAARTAALDDPVAGPAQAGRAAVSGWLADGTTISVSDTGGEVRATARIEIPSVIPGVSFGTAERTATMPRTRDTPVTPAAPGPPGGPARSAAAAGSGGAR